MRANANATILNKGTAIENPEIKKRSSICLLTNELLFARRIYEWCGSVAIEKIEG